MHKIKFNIVHKNTKNEPKLFGKECLVKQLYKEIIVNIYIQVNKKKKQTDKQKFKEFV